MNWVLRRNSFTFPERKCEDILSYSSREILLKDLCIFCCRNKIWDSPELIKFLNFFFLVLFVVCFLACLFVVFVCLFLVDLFISTVLWQEYHSISSRHLLKFPGMYSLSSSAIGCNILCIFNSLRVFVWIFFSSEIF